MGHRTQITLTDRQYAELRKRSRATGVSLAELVRRAVDESYGRDDREAAVEAIRASAGAWRDRDEDGVEYQKRIRDEGLGWRLKDR
jgi:hypothetical protein